jgi:hypothetical protein
LWSEGITTDNLLRKGIHCDPVCALCDQDVETADHLCLHCVFEKEVWMVVHVWSKNSVAIPVSGVTLLDWWNNATVVATRGIPTVGSRRRGYLPSLFLRLREIRGEIRDWFYID